MLENITRNENCKITSSSTNLPSNYFWRVLRLHIEVIFRFKYLSNIHTSNARFDFKLTSANESYKPSKEDEKELNTVTSYAIERTVDASDVSLSDKSSSYSKNSMLMIENTQKFNNLIYKPTAICSELNDCTNFNTHPPNNGQVKKRGPLSSNKFNITLFNLEINTNEILALIFFTLGYSNTNKGTDV